MRQARCFLATGLLLAVAVPGALAAAPASASPTRPAQPVRSAVTVTITKMTPQWAKPGTTITVTGTVTNTSKTPQHGLTVELRSSNRAVASLNEMLQDTAAPTPLASSSVSGHVLQPAGVLQPGSSSSWQISFPATRLKLTAFGVYPLTAQVDSSVGTLLSFSNTFLPYVPAKRGKHAKSVPAKQRIAWVWPLIDTPLIALPGQRDCSAQARALAASMAAGGRLNGLLSVGGAYTGVDKLTWAVDPALLSDAADLSQCSDAPGLAKAAATWLRQLKKATAGQHLFVTPYANVNLALIRHSHTSDVNTAFTVGRRVAQDILKRYLTPSTAPAPSDAGTAWPSDDVSSPLLQNLALKQEVRTVVLSSDSVAGAKGTAFNVPEGPGQVRVLLSADSLTKLLSSATAAPGSAFATSQQFLAETALMAGQGAASPIVVAPPQQPQNWHPPAGLAATLLADTASAPWLAPVSLNTLAASATTTDNSFAPLPAGNSGSLSGRMLHQIGLADQAARQISNIEAEPTPGMEASEAIAALESADWGPHTQPARLDGFKNLTKHMNDQLRQVLILADSRVTLGGLKGPVPVEIENGLDYAVKVQLRPSFHQPPGGGLTVHQKPTGLVTVPARSQRTTTLRVQATQVGSSLITLQLFNKAGKPLPAQTRKVIVQATQLGTFAMIILASALGLFTIASAARAIRRGRPASPDSPDDAGHPDPDASDGSQQPPGPDNVFHERTELGAAGTPGP